jgi:putative SOS response-associated peptidase YedK
MDVRAGPLAKQECVATRTNGPARCTIEFTHVLFRSSDSSRPKLHAMEHRELRAGEAETNVVLQFTPDPPRTMFIACLWSHWTDPKDPDVRGFAAITDEPPADVAAAGHDRCIINLKPEHVDAWLTPEGRSADELQAILSDRVIPVIQHPMAA